jgi:SAM-dependent methyltransferase
MGPISASEQLAAPTYLAERWDAVHRRHLWDPFARLAPRLDSAIGALLRRTDGATAGTVVDLGCDTSPYRHHLAPDARYIGVDLPGNDAADLSLRPDGSVPLADASADLILSTQVLEHVRDPAHHLQECARLLRPGGQLVLTTHGIMFLHRDPEDLWRWTSDGLRRTVEAAGLEVEDRAAVFGLVATGLQLTLIGVLRRSPRWLRRPITVAFQLAIGVADRSADPIGLDDGLVIGVRAVKRSIGVTA